MQRYYLVYLLAVTTPHRNYDPPPPLLAVYTNRTFPKLLNSKPFVFWGGGGGEGGWNLLSFVAMSAVPQPELSGESQGVMGFGFSLSADPNPDEAQNSRQSPNKP